MGGSEKKNQKKYSSVFFLIFLQESSSGAEKVAYQILQGLGVCPGSATERWPCRKNARKSFFFVKKLKLPQNTPGFRGLVQAPRPNADRTEKSAFIRKKIKIIFKKYFF